MHVKYSDWACERRVLLFSITEASTHRSTRFKGDADFWLYVDRHVLSVGEKYYFSVFSSSVFYSTSKLISRTENSPCANMYLNRPSNPDQRFIQTCAAHVTDYKPY